MSADGQLADCHRRDPRAAFARCAGQRPGMAPPLSFLLSELRSEDRGPKSLKTVVVYLVRSFGLMPESTSHDWHVQPSCQRPNRDPPERREFSPGENAARANPTVLETLQTYSPL